MNMARTLAALIGLGVVGAGATPAFARSNRERPPLRRGEPLERIATGANRHSDATTSSS